MNRLIALCAAAVLSSSAFPVAAGCLDDVKSSGVLTAGNGLMGTRPFVWQNEDGSYCGFEADMLKEVGKRIGVPKTDFVVTEWSTLIPVLKSKRWNRVRQSCNEG